MIRSAVVVKGNKGVAGTLAANAGDVKLRAVVDSAIFGNGTPVEVSGLSLSLEKPGFFIVDYDVPEQDVRFQFMNTVNVFDKRLNWTYAHSRNENRTVVDGTFVLDPANKVSASHELRSRNCKLKYSYVHRGATSLETCYDFGKNSWDLAVSHRFDRFDGDVIKASYEAVSKKLGIEWWWKSSLSQEGRFKILAAFNLAEGLHMPKLSAESSWNFEGMEGKTRETKPAACVMAFVHVLVRMTNFSVPTSTALPLLGATYFHVTVSRLFSNPLLLTMGRKGSIRHSPSTMNLICAVT